MPSPLRLPVLRRLPYLAQVLRLLALLRLVRRAGRALRRLRRHGPAALLAALAAGLAYAAASAAFGREEAFFAPIAAVVCVGIAAGQRIRRAVEIAVGVAVGLAAADLLVRLIGAGAVQLGAAVGLAMAAAVLLGTSAVLVNQAAVAAVLVVALPQGQSSPLTRFGDALIGGGVALALGAVLAPDRHRHVQRAGARVLEHLTAVLHGLAETLADSDLPRAERLLREAGEVDEQVAELDHALAAARESARLGRRRALAAHRPMLLLRDRMDLLAATTRALARATANAVRHGRPVDERLATGVDQLAVALAELQRWAEGTGDAEGARAAALRAVATAAEVPEPRPLAASVLVGQIRSCAVDVLRTTGLDQRTAVRLLEETAGRADRPG